MRTKKPEEKDIGKETGKEAGSPVRRETVDGCRALGITPHSVLLNLKRLSRFKGAKAFSFQGQIIYSEPMDYPETQLAATKELAAILGMRPAEKHEVENKGTVTIRIKGKDDATE